MEPAGVRLVGFYGDDDVTSLYIGRLLSSKGISFKQEGAFLRTVSVSRRDFDSARQLLESEEGLRGFLLWPSSREENDIPFDGADIDLAYPEALEKYSALTVVGRILRSRDFPTPIKIEAVERIVRVEWRIRPFVSATLTATQAIQGRVSFLRSFPERPYKLYRASSAVAVFESE